MANADQEAYRGIRLQSASKALPAGHGQSQETQPLHDNQRGLSVDTQHNTPEFGSMRTQVRKKRALDLVNEVNSSPQLQPTVEEWQPLKYLEPSTQPLVRWEVSHNPPILEAHKQAGGELQVVMGAQEQVVASRQNMDSLSTVETLPAITGAQSPALIKRDIYPVAIKQGINASEPMNGKAVAKRKAESQAIVQASPRQISRYDPSRGVIVRPEALPLTPKVDPLLTGKSQPSNLLPSESLSRNDTALLESEVVQTKNRRKKRPRAENIVLEAIRSQADSDGRNAKVSYDALAAMTPYTTRHVKRVVKSLIYERGLLRVDKRRLKPGRNAINIYHLVDRDITTTDKDIDAKTGKTGHNDPTRVTESVTQIAKPRTIPPLRHVPSSSALVTEKQGSTHLPAGRKLRYLTHGGAHQEKVAVKAGESTEMDRRKESQNLPASRPRLLLPA